MTWLSSDWSMRSPEKSTDKVQAKKSEEPRRKVAAYKVEDEPVPPSRYKRVSIDMSDYVPPEPKQSRVTASVEKQLVSNKSRFALADAVAVETEKFNAAMGEEIEEKAGFTIYKPTDKTKIPGFTLEERTRPVVVNQASGAIGVVTGTIVVRLKDFEEADSVASAFGLEYVSSDDSIATVFYKAPKGREIDDLIEMLRADGRVTRADAEIIQSTRQIH
ncbi:MAG: hypothetical protein V4760_03835, partial [Bdellovibrionota bacterium]